MKNNNVDRRSFLQQAIGLTAGITSANFASARSSSRPNFIFILTDDQRYDALGCAGNPLIQTPTLDALATRGTRFENAFVTTSICSPSRAACLTGRYGSANGVRGLSNNRLHDTERTFAHRFKEAGYRTGMVGKWHLKNSPQECGFDYFPHFAANGPYYDRSVIEDGKRKIAKGFIEDYNTAQSIAFLRSCEKENAPFILFHCTQLAHMNHEFDWNVHPETVRKYPLAKMPVPASWQDDLSGKPPYLKEARSHTRAMEYGYDSETFIQRHFQRYFAAVTELDAALGTLLDEAGRLGLNENTYIIFMGDNGWFMGEHGFTSKVLAYEESIRVPMVIAGPGIAHGVNKDLVLNVDLAPMMYDLANLPIPKNTQGKPLTPLLTNQSQPNWRSQFLYEALQPELGSWPLQAIRTHDWKYIRTYDINNPKETAFEELYNLKNDPTEMNNLAGDPIHIDTQKKLIEEMDQLRKEIKGAGE